MLSPMHRTFLMKLNDRTVLAPHDYLFQVPGQSGCQAAELRLGDLVYDYDNQLVSITAITDLGEQPLLGCMGTNEPPYYQAGLILPGTLVLTAEGCKRIEDLRPGDRILAPEDVAPNPIQTMP